MNEIKRDSFIFYRSFYESINSLPVENQLNIYKAIASLSLNGNNEDLQGIENAIFTLIKPQIEANNKKYLNGKIPKNSSEEKTSDKQNRSKNEAKYKQIKSKSEANEECRMNNEECRMNNEKKNKYGLYKHVLLTQTEYNKLLKDYANAEECITFLDEYIEMKGYKAKSHYLAVKKWVVDAVNERSIKNKPNKKVDVLPAYYTGERNNDVNVEFDPNDFKAIPSK